MVARGIVHGGVIVLQDGQSLPEGQEVTVYALPEAKGSGHSVLDIPPISGGTLLVPFTTSDDLLGEMLEGRS